MKFALLVLAFTTALTSISASRASAEVLLVKRSANNYGQAYLYWDQQRRCRAITALHVLARGGFGAKQASLIATPIMRDENGHELNGRNARLLPIEGDVKQDVAVMEVQGRPENLCSESRLRDTIPSGVMNDPAAWLRYFEAEGPSRAMRVRVTGWETSPGGPVIFQIKPDQGEPSIRATMSGGTVYVRSPDPVTGQEASTPIGMLREVAPDEHSGLAIRHDSIAKALRSLDRSAPPTTPTAATIVGARAIDGTSTIDEAFGPDRVLQPTSDGCGWRLRAYRQRIVVEWTLAKPTTFTSLRIRRGCRSTADATMLTAVAIGEAWGPEIMCRSDRSGYVGSCSQAPRTATRLRTIFELTPGSNELEIGPLEFVVE